MDNSDLDLTLTPGMQEMIAQMAQMRAELDSLKQRAQVLPQHPQPITPTITSTRRKTLKRLGLTLLGGAIAATTVDLSAAQARVAANPALGTSTSKAGAIVVPLGVGNPTGNAPNGYYYGLIALGTSVTLDLSTLPKNYIGVYGNGATGVYGNGVNTGVIGSGSLNGVSGDGSTGVSGSGTSTGVSGDGPTGVFGSGGTGVVGTGTSTGVSGSGITGVSGTDSTFDATGTGVYGKSARYAGLFDGPAWVTGPLSKPAGSFKIDHPLDPENKYLYHSFVESPDMKNIYDGVVVLNEQGAATVEMHGWFEALNSDFRYQLTSIGVSMPDLYIAEKLTDCKFKIAGGKPGQEVSWQVTGIRQDEWAKAHPIPVEEDKSGAEKGKYLYPKVFGKSEEFKIDLLNNLVV